MPRVSETFRFDDVVVRPDVFSVEKSGRAVALEPKSIRLLIYLIENRPRAISKEELFDKIWQDSAVTDNALTRVVAQLRKAIGDDAKVARYIETVPTLGYRFIAEISDAESPVAPIVILDSPKPQPLWMHGFYALLLSAIIVAVIGWQRSHVAEAPQWTGNLLGGSIIASHPRISPDGQLLAFRAIVDGLSQPAVMKPDAQSWTVLSNDRQHGAITSVAWARDGSKIYFDRQWGPGNIYSIGPLGGEPRLVLANASMPEPLPDGSLIALRPSSEGRQQLIRFWPDSGRLESLPAAVQSSDAPRVRVFPDGKEIAVLGLSGALSSTDSGAVHLFALDLASGKARELADSALPIESLAVTADGKSVLVQQVRDDTEVLLSLPRDGSKKARAMLSFPAGAAPLSFDPAPDGSIYLDQSHFEMSILSFKPDGGVIAGIPLPQRVNDVLPVGGGQTVFSMWRSGHSKIFVGKAGSEPRLLLNTGESARLPGAWLGNGRMAFIIGKRPEMHLAIAFVEDGRVVQRFPADAQSVTAVSAAPDGQTIYYAANGTLWAQPVSGGDPKKIGEGYDIAVDPSGRFLYLMRTGAKGYGLWRMPTAGGDAEEMEIPPGYNLTPNRLSAAAVNRDGRILLPVNKLELFFYKVAIYDPVRHTMTDVPVPLREVALDAGWAPEGNIVARLTHWSSSLWRYRMLLKNQ